MSDTPDNLESGATPASPAPASIGEQLARAREAAGLTMAAAAARLRCDESIVAALEAERFGELGAPVFAQGHLRRYADSLGLPVDALLTQWSARHAAAVAAPDLTQVPRPNRPVRIVDPGKIARPLAVVAAAIVITLAAWWVLQGAGTAVEPVAAKPVPELTAESVPAAAPELSAPPVTPPPPAVTPAPVAPAPVAPVAAPSLAAASRLVLVVSADCWMEITDSRGRRVFYGTANQGARIRVAGTGPWQILAGRADALTLEIDGRRQPVPAEIIRQTTANFTVDTTGKITAIVRAPTP